MEAAGNSGWQSWSFANLYAHHHPALQSADLAGFEPVVAVLALVLAVAPGQVPVPEPVPEVGVGFEVEAAFVVVVAAAVPAEGAIVLLYFADTASCPSSAVETAG